MQMISRRIDQLGRIVLPKDFRDALGLGLETEVLLSIEGDTITIRGANETCKLCHSSTEVSRSIGLCAACVRKIKSISDTL